MTQAGVRAGTELGYRPGLDGLRAVAVLLVVARHVTAEDQLVGFGWVGVGMFFVLSGFLITSLLLEEHAATGAVSLPRFYRRRACRLLPALALLLVAWWAVAPDAGLATAGYVANYAVAGGADLGPFSHAWSLAVEEHFYLVWPVAFLWLARRGRLECLPWIAGSVAVYRVLLLVAGVELDWLRRATDARMDMLLIGCALAVAVKHRSLIVPGWLTRAAVAVAAGLALLVPDASVFTVTVGYPLMGLCAAVLILHAYQGDQLLGAWPLRGIGRVSYGVYLWHFPIAWWLVERGWDYGPTFTATVIAGTALAVAVSWRYVEQPAMRLGRREATQVQHEVREWVVG